MANIFTPPDIVTEMPVAVSIRGWTSRLKAEDTLSVSMSLGFIFTDLKQQFSLTIRCGICQYEDSLPVDANLLISLNKATFDQIQLGYTDILSAVEKGDIKLKGTSSELQRFLGYFEDPGASPISLTIH
jgi:alkyl sulfatase BDS1-like metallo-beta-lactamase superfamily hydrolase